MPDNLDASAVDAAAELGRSIANADRSPQPYDVTDTTCVIVRVHRDNEHVAVHDLERLLEAPQRARGQTFLDDPNDFATYVERLTTGNTMVYADHGGYRVTAIFNDHDHVDLPGWRDHRAVYQPQRDPDFAVWQQMSGELLSQTEFAEFIETVAHNVTDPDAARMLEIATTFSAHRSATFSRSARLQSGDVSLQWHEETSAKAGKSGQLEIPETFTVTISPFAGATARPLLARLRYRVADGTLRIGFQLHRPDLVTREAFQDVRDMLAQRLSAPVLLGRAPDVVAPR